MNYRLCILLCALSAVLSISLTKYYFPNIQTKVVETTKEVIKNDIQTVTRTVTLPNGATDTTTTTTDHSQRIQQDTKQTLVAKSSTINVSALVANDFSRGLISPTYGVSISKEIVGPITVGLFGLTNSTVGLSLGINF